MQSKDSFKTVSLPNGEVYAYREAGDPSKKVLVMIHGNFSCSRAWNRVIPDLQDELRLIAPDMRGYGNSTYNKPITTITDYADDLKLFLDALGLTKVSLIGWSFGGGVSLQFACKYPEYVDKVILHCSVGARGAFFTRFDENNQPTKFRITSDEEMRTRSTRLWGANAIKKQDAEFVKSYFINVCCADNKPDEELLEEIVANALQQNSDCFMDVSCALNRFNVTDYTNELGPGTNEIANYKAPTLILAGELDKLADVSEQEFTKKAIGDLCELKVYPNVGHCLFYEIKDEFIKQVRKFLL